MAKKWSEVVANPQYQALPDDQKEAARAQYFQEVVAPQVSPDQVQAARAEFDADTGPRGSVAPHADDVPYANGANPYTDDDLHPEAMAPERPRTMSDYGNEAIRGAELAGRTIAKVGASVPDLVVAPAAMLVNKGLDAAGVDPKYHQMTVNQALDQGLAQIGAPVPETTAERYIDAAGQGLGSVALGAGAGGVLARSASPAASAAGKALTSNLGQQAVGGALSGAGVEAARESGASPLTQLAVGVGLGAAPGLAGLAGQAGKAAIAQTFGKVDQETQALAQMAKAEGIPLKASQVSSSKAAKALDSVTGQVPFSGARQFADNQQQAFNAAVARTIGETADKITPQVFARAKQRIGSEFDRLAASTNLPLDPQLAGKLSQVVRDTRDFYGNESAQLVTNVINRLVKQNVGGVVPGKAFQSIDSEIGKALAKGGEKTVPLGDLQEALRDAVEANIAPEDAAAWATARQQYRDLKTIEPLVAKDGQTTGNISPAALMGRVTSNGAGKSSMAAGRRGDLGDLAAIGQRFVKETIPDSGTARRVAIQDALGKVGLVGAGAGASYAGAGATAAGLAGLVGTSRFTQKLLQDPAIVNKLVGLGYPRDEAIRALAGTANPALTGSQLATQP